MLQIRYNFKLNLDIFLTSVDYTASLLVCTEIVINLFDLRPDAAEKHLILLNLLQLPFYILVDFELSLKG